MRKKKKSKFPDLTGDGKTTMADILKGKGVIESEDFIGEVINRVEESFAVEDEISEILESLEEEGYDIESLTEEDLNEIFYGLRKRLGYTTAKEDRNDRFRRRIQKRKLKRDKANATKYKEDQKAKKDAQRQKDAGERYAPKKSDDKAVTTLATRGSGAEEKSSGGKPTTAAIRKKLALKADPGDRHLPNTADSTDIVRGARMALAEKVISTMLSEEERSQKQ